MRPSGERCVGANQPARLKYQLASQDGAHNIRGTKRGDSVAYMSDNVIGYRYDRNGRDEDDDPALGL